MKPSKCLDGRRQSAQSIVVTAQAPSAREPEHLTIEQRMRRAIAIYDAKCSLLRQGWDPESVLSTTWTVEVQSDGACTAQMVTDVQRTHPESGVVEAGHTADLIQSAFNCRDAAEGLKVDVYLSREALAQLGSGKDLLLKSLPTEGEEIAVVEVRVGPWKGP